MYHKIWYNIAEPEEEVINAGDTIVSTEEIDTNSEELDEEAMNEEDIEEETDGVVNIDPGRNSLIFIYSNYIYYGYIY